MILQFQLFDQRSLLSLESIQSTADADCFGSGVSGIAGESSFWQICQKLAMSCLTGHALPLLRPLCMPCLELGAGQRQLPAWRRAAPGGRHGQPIATNCR